MALRPRLNALLTNCERSRLIIRGIQGSVIVTVSSTPVCLIPSGPVSYFMFRGSVFLLLYPTVRATYDHATVSKHATKRNYSNEYYIQQGLLSLRTVKNEVFILIFKS